MHQVSHLAVIEHKDTLKQNNIHRIDDTNIWTPAGGGRGEEGSLLQCHVLIRVKVTSCDCHVIIM